MSHGIDLTVVPEANPAPDASSARPERVNAYDEDASTEAGGGLGGPAADEAAAAAEFATRVSAPSTPTLSATTSAAAGRQTLTTLYSDDIFRMKELRACESVSASEAAEFSVLSVANGEEGELFASEQNADGSANYGSAHFDFDPTAAHDSRLDLNEEDLFR